MDNQHKRHNFLDYINTPMSKESINVLYSANDIKFEKCELYSDFVQSLLRLAFDTYLGDDVTSVEQQIIHFKWCWDKNLTNFRNEGLLFDNTKLYEYFLEFMLEVYYTSIEKNQFENPDKMLLKLWFNIFDYGRVKTHSDIDTLVEIYKIFEKSLKTV